MCREETRAAAEGMFTSVRISVFGGVGGATVAAAGGELEAGEGGGGRGRGWDGMSAHGGETSASSAL